MHRTTILLVVWIGVCAPLADADIVLYKVPGSTLAFVLQGSVSAHPGKLFQWYQLIGKKPLGKELSPKQLLESFEEVFGKDKTALDREWRQYMQSLKTDLQRVIEEAQ